MDIKEKDKEKLRVIPYTGDEKKKYKHEVPGPLPKSTSSFILVGSTGSGKSNIARNIIRIMGKNWKKPNRFLIQSTKDSDTTLTNKFYDYNIFDEYNDEIYKGIIDIIKEENNERIKENRRPEEFLLILDDMIGLIKSNSRIWSDFVLNRHHHLTIILSTQKFRAIPPVSRYNSMNYIIFSGINNKELKAISEELNKDYPNNLFMNTFKEKIKGYNFLYINVRERKYLINFVEEFITPEDLENYKNSKFD